MKRAYWDPTIASRYPILSRLSSRFRARRAAEFIKRLNVDANKRILDVGGEPYFWESFPVQCGVVCLNLHSMVSRSPRIAVETYDGMRLPYDDKAFDIVFSNSVIEHVGEAGRLRLGISKEIARDVLWAMNSPEFYRLLVVGRRWTGEEFENWLADAWQRLLLDDDPSSTGQTPRRRITKA